MEINTFANARERAEYPHPFLPRKNRSQNFLDLPDKKRVCFGFCKQMIFDQSFAQFEVVGKFRKGGYFFARNFALLRHERQKPVLPHIRNGENNRAFVQIHDHFLRVGCKADRAAQIRFRNFEQKLGERVIAQISFDFQVVLRRHCRIEGLGTSGNYRQIYDNKKTRQKLRNIFVRAIYDFRRIIYHKNDVKPEITIRECVSVGDLGECVALQREIFALPEIEISPVRHFVVTRGAGGFTLGAFAGGALVGFVLSVPAFLGNKKFFYSHMTAVKREFQSHGIGARLKWAQRDEALARNVDYIKWTFQPVQARNAFFNLEKLGAIVREYQPNFYGTDYSTLHMQGGNLGIDSDRLFAEWNLTSEKTRALSKGESYKEKDEVARKIEIPNDWNALVEKNPSAAIKEQARIKNEFQTAFAENLIVKGFERSETNPRFLLYEE